MNLDDCRTVFVSSSLVLVLIAASPTLGLVIPFPRGGERFSELWVLGPSHMAEDYPFNITINDNYNVIVGVRNHLGYFAYYRIDVKFRNQTQPLPDSLNSIPSPLNSIYRFQLFLEDGKIWETPLNFSFHGNTTFVRDISINDVVFSVDRPSTWNPQSKGFYYQLFLELWLYDVMLRSFQFHNRFVGIWLNLTG